jgi:CheY-like chemotaxis protein
MKDEQTQRFKSILVVEDHHESAELIRMILEEGGYQVLCVETGRDALQVSSPASRDENQEFHADLILLDLRLPDMDGVEVVRELRKNQPRIPPIVFLSANPLQSLKDAADSVGAVSLRKPFDFDELFRVIERAFAKTASA